MNHFDNRDIVVGKNVSAQNNKKGASGVQMTHTLRVEIDAQEGNLKSQKYEVDFVRKVIQFRTSKGWNQQTFAQNLQLQLPIIRGIEANNIPVNNAYVQKINNYINRATVKSST
jgi:ribosome-binding protein aMBF1 (putative translation factor)